MSSYMQFPWSNGTTNTPKCEAVKIHEYANRMRARWWNIYTARVSFSYGPRGYQTNESAIRRNKSRTNEQNSMTLLGSRAYAPWHSLACFFIASRREYGLKQRWQYDWIFKCRLATCRLMPRLCNFWPQSRQRHTSTFFSFPCTLWALRRWVPRWRMPSEMIRPHCTSSSIQWQTW